jgi:tryptophan 2,3-dioxygenase
MGGTPKGPTYWDYLRVPELLSLQGGLEKDESALCTDELHFIIVHQVYELWFKLCLRELRVARDHLAAPKVPEEAIAHVVHHLGRVGKVLHLLVEQFTVMETLTPQDFLAFRDKLTPASGFQSHQLRELEVLMGLGDEQRVAYGSTHALAHLESMAKDSKSGSAMWGRLETARGRRACAGRSTLALAHAHPGERAGRSRRCEASSGSSSTTTSRASAPTSARSSCETTNADPAVVEKRFEEEAKNVERFLFALDVPEARSADAIRIRAALVFIESYRELPAPRVAAAAARQHRRGRGAVRALAPPPRADGRARDRTTRRDRRLVGRRLPRPDRTHARVPGALVRAHASAAALGSAGAAAPRGLRLRAVGTSIRRALSCGGVRRGRRLEASTPAALRSPDGASMPGRRFDAGRRFGRTRSVAIRRPQIMVA